MELSRLRLRWTFLFAGVLQAIGMFIDAFQIYRGAGQEDLAARPWARLVERIGLDPAAFAPVLLLLGIAWLIVTVAILRGSQRARRPAVVVAVASLWYVIAGAGLAVIYLLALATLREDGGDA